MSRTPTARITADRLTEFEPRHLGSSAAFYRGVLGELNGRRQSEIIALLEDKVRAIDVSTDDPDLLAARVSLLVMRDYVEAGHYPIIRSGRCYLANIVDSDSLTEEQQRTVLRRQYEVARDRALRDRGHLDGLTESVRNLQHADYAAHTVVSELSKAAPEVELLDTRQNVHGYDTRQLWRTVRSTWSMAPEASAPGREVALVAVDRRWPGTPLGIVQFRNVVPEISARDMWLGVSLGGSTSSRDSNRGFIGILNSQPSLTMDRAKSTLTMMELLCGHIQHDGIELEFREENIQQLGALVRLERQRFDETRREGAQGLNNEHLKRMKRVQTGYELLRGIRALRAIVSGSVVLENLGTDLERDLTAGLSKVWHYQMGFVAVEMSICGAAPPFGPMRVGKLMAALAGSAVVAEAWGADRPLGAIAKEVYHPDVRMDVPNSGPLVVFTSGLFPGHSAQYNRVTSGSSRWSKIGSTSGFGSFHISFETTESMRRLNEVTKGYQHVTRKFGEGSGARFRSVGRALGHLGLPDFRKHETARPLYALPLVRNPQAAILGWEPPDRYRLPDPQEIAEEWWGRWVAPHASELGGVAQRVPDLEATVFEMLQRAGSTSTK
jgi:hypothetical protein